MTPYYDDGQCVIYHGDCRDFEWRLAQVDAIVTDPPYGIADVWVGGGGGNKTSWKFKATETHDWDREAPAFVAELPAKADHCIIWGGNYFHLPPKRGWLIWDKIVREFSSGHCEMAWTTLDQPVRAFNYAHAQLASEGKYHPTQKPLPLMSWCLSFLPDARVIVDPYMGSGTTLRAAKDRGLHAIGIELEERYCEIAANRLAQGVLDFGASA